MPVFRLLRVALLAEGVDRNILMLILLWITCVALLAEGVDRNLLADCWGVLNVVSPSSRRAWIEITRFFEGRPTICVALLAEGVDRNSSHPLLCIREAVALLAEGVDRN